MSLILAHCFLIVRLSVLLSRQPKAAASKSEVKAKPKGVTQGQASADAHFVGLLRPELHSSGAGAAPAEEEPEEEAPVEEARAGIAAVSVSLDDINGALSCYCVGLCV